MAKIFKKRQFIELWKLQNEEVKTNHVQPSGEAVSVCCDEVVEISDDEKFVITREDSKLVPQNEGLVSNGKELSPPTTETHQKKGTKRKHKEKKSYTPKIKIKSLDYGTKQTMDEPLQMVNNEASLSDEFECLDLKENEHNNSERSVEVKKEKKSMTTNSKKSGTKPQREKRNSDGPEIKKTRTSHEKTPNQNPDVMIVSKQNDLNKIKETRRDPFEKGQFLIRVNSPNPPSCMYRVDSKYLLRKYEAIAENNEIRYRMTGQYFGRSSDYTVAKVKIIRKSKFEVVVQLIES